MSIAVSRLKDGELDEFRVFCAAAWGSEHPLIHNAEMFEYYYRAADGELNFACARDDDSGELLSVRIYTEQFDRAPRCVDIISRLKKGRALRACV